MAGRERGICNVCNVTRRCHLCPWLFVRTPCERKRVGGRAYSRLASDAARAIKRARTTSSAPALITARRRSYFTPRSSIIHAVNNAPLFRVTLYRGSPSFLPCPSPTFCEDEGCGRGRVVKGGGELRVFPRGRRLLSDRTEVGGAYPVETLLSPGPSTETETRFGLTAREGELAV